MINAGIVEIIYNEEYEDKLSAQLLKESTLVVRRVEVPRMYGRNAKANSR